MPHPPAAPVQSDRLSFKENLGFGLGDMASNFFFQTFGIFLLYYYTDVFGIEPAAAGTMFFLTRLVDAFTDPAMGAMADRTKRRESRISDTFTSIAAPLRKKASGSAGKAAFGSGSGSGRRGSGSGSGRRGEGWDGA